ncbi:Prophage integrase IntS [uncultured Comamonas sp.]|nr:Prophage integrase IntS [uncultured Comamonas sp.]
MALTDTFIKQTKWSGKAVGDKHSDGGGLYLHVKSVGKYWRMAYRYAGKQKSLAFGVYPTVTLADARSQREKARELLARGEDPSDTLSKRARTAASKAAAGNSVKVIGDAWLALHKDGWSVSHYDREKRNLEKDVYPYLGSRPLGEIEPPELLRIIRKVEERGALSVSHRVLTTARGVWQYAIAEGYALRDVTQDIARALKPHFKRNHPAIVSPFELAGLLRASDSYKGGPVVRAALKLAPILFQRPGNLRAMRWQDLDMERGLWAIPSEDMKRTKAQKLNGQAHIVPLPRQVLAELQELHSLTGRSVYVFPGLRDRAKPMSEAAVNAALHSMGYKGRHCWHGYRATGRTILRQELKYDPDVIEAQLAHKGQITHGGAYDRARFIEERTNMLQQWADYLDKLRHRADILQFPAA